MGSRASFGIGHTYDIFDAIDNENEIHSLFMGGKDCSHPRVKWCHDYGSDISEQLTEEEKWIVNAVGKTLWGVRVQTAQPRESHSQYESTIDEQITRSLEKLQEIRDPRLQQLANKVTAELASLQLPMLAAA